MMTAAKLLCFTILTCVMLLAVGCAPAQRSQGRSNLRKPPTKGSMMMEVTAYCPCKKCCGPNARGMTASGQKVTYHNGTFVSADTNVLPFYTWLVVPGYNHGRPVPVLDRGSSRIGNKLDVFFPSHSQALRWGRRTVQVKIVPAPGGG